MRMNKGGDWHRAPAVCRPALAFFLCKLADILTCLASLAQTNLPPPPLSSSGQDSDNVFQNES
eukprot:3315390-Pyramimonas_sp.AAC.1